MQNTKSPFSTPFMDQANSAFSGMMEDALKHSQKLKGAQMSELFNPKKMLSMLSQGIQADPENLLQQQMSFMEKQLQLWQSASQALINNQDISQLATAEGGDGRFSADDWDSHPFYNYLKQAYLLNAEQMETMVESLEFEDSKTASQVKFFTRQFISALSPSNYALTNPEVCREILETKGESLIKGMENFVNDLKQSPADAFKIRQTDTDAFELGKNLAATPGEVVFQNDLMQLLQYSPTTEKCQQKPLLFVPAFINKYYILDLDHKKSMVRWMVEQGYTVFLISWVNPDETLADKQFEDYMLEGPVAALDAIEQITGETSINTAGYCVGGTLLAVTQAYLQSKGDTRINSMTFFTSLLDFDEPGELGNFISEQIMTLLEEDTQAKGMLDGRVLGMSFSMLRENSLLWPFFVNNYLKGKTPSAFDLLYWNSDSTNLPAQTFSFYIRNAYLDNRFREPGGVEVDGVPIDLSQSQAPAYFVATKADHIALWESAYQSARCLGPGRKKEGSGKTTKSKQQPQRRFVLAGSGHIAGIINPAETGKYPHWVCNESQGDLPEKPAQWLEQAEQVDGSWWHDWHQWLGQRSGKAVTARQPGEHTNFPALEAAPGSYVRVRI